MKKILFTGARSGIINKVVDYIINLDYFVYITVHTERELEALYEKYKYKDNVKCMKIDVTKKEDKEKIKDLDIDILVSNAATGASGSIAEIDMNKVRKNFEINVFSNFEIVQTVLKKMIKKGYGRIIMMGSLAGVLPLPFGGSYSATKASISRLTEALYLETKLLEAKIDVCLIEPGLYRTGFNKLLFDQKYDDMDVSTYFDKQIELIRKSENLFLKLFERKKLDSIVNKIIKSIVNKKVHFIYSAPFSQKLVSRIYCLFR